MDERPESLFEVDTRLGFRVRVPASRWALIVSNKHPAMRGREHDVEQTLGDPDEVRESRADTAVFLFYRLDRPGRWICAVARRVDVTDGFLITAYPTDAVKEGRRLWTR
jgi:hypothetical protein